MAYTLNRRLAQLINSDGQINTGKIPNDYISSDHIADNVITSAMLHTGFTVSASNVSSIDTDDVSEGSSNLYFTNARVDSRLSGGTGVTYSSGTISIGQAVATTSNVTFADLTVTGNLSITGDINSYNVTDLDVTDQTITLGVGQTEANSGGSGIIIDGSSASILWDETNDTFDINKGLTTTGNIGIGEGSPDAPLHITSNTPIISFDESDASQEYRIGSFGGSFALYDSTDSAYRFVIDGSGNVGIGTTTPSHLLHIQPANSDTLANAIFTRQNNAAGSDGNSFSLRNDAANNFVEMNSGGTNNGGYKFYISNFSSDPALTIVGAGSNSGNVGIGETSPIGKLHIKGTDTGASASAQGNSLVLEDTENGLSILSSTAGAGYINFGDSGDNNIGMIIYDHSSNSMRFWTNAAERLKIESSGDLVLSGDSEHKLRKITTSNITSNAVETTELMGRNIDLYSYDDINFRAGTSDQIRFYAGGAKRMHIKETGAVGIGIATPVEMLDIQTSSGDCRIRLDAPTSSDTEIKFFNNGAVNYTIGHDDATDNFVIGGTNVDDPYVVVNKSKYVGIDTSSPSAPLMFGKSVYGDFDAENFYRIKFQDQGGIHNDVGIGQTASGSMGFNVTSGGGFFFNDGTGGQAAKISGSAITIGTGGTNDSVRTLISGGTTVITAADANHRIILRGTQNAAGSITGNTNTMAFYEYGGYDFYSGVNVGSSARVLAMQIDAAGETQFPRRVVVGDNPAVSIPNNTLLARQNSSSGVHYPIVIGGGTHSAGVAFGLAFDPEGYGNRNKMAILAEGIGAGYSRGRLHFAINSTGNTDQVGLSDSKMCITESGNIGIGDQIDGPSGKLTIVGGRAGISSTDSSWGQFRIANTSVAEVGLTFLNGATTSEFLSDSDPSYNTGSGGRFIVGISPFGCGTDTFGIGHAAVGDSIFHIDSQGRFGLGKASENPTHDFEFINRDAQKILELTRSRTSGTQPAGAGETGHALMLRRLGIAFDRCWAEYPSLTVLRDSSYTSNNSYQLEFRFHGTNSDIANYPAANGSDFSVNLRIDGSAYNSSDARKKTNIESIGGALSIVNQLDGKKFNVINSAGETQDHISKTGKKFGLLAQDIEDIIPEAVTYYPNEDDGTDGYNNAYGLDYASLTALLINAIKEQDVVIQDLKSRIETLEG